MVFIVATGTFGKEVSLNTQTITKVTEFPKEEMLKKMAEELETEAFRLHGGVERDVPIAVQEEYEAKYQEMVEAWEPISSAVHFTDGSSFYTVETPSEIAQLANIALSDPLQTAFASKLALTEVKGTVAARLKGLQPAP